MSVSQYNRVSWPMRLLLASGVSITCVLTGCLTIEQMAPPVGPEFSSFTVGGASRTVLERGREVYLADCTRCHSIEPINRYSIDRWHTIVERMGPQSKLDEAGTAALQAYLVAAHKVLEREPAGSNATE